MYVQLIVCARESVPTPKRVEPSSPETLTVGSKSFHLRNPGPGHNRPRRGPTRHGRCHESRETGGRGRRAGGQTCEDESLGRGGSRRRRSPQQHQILPRRQPPERPEHSLCTSWLVWKEQLGAWRDEIVCVVGYNRSEEFRPMCFIASIDNQSTIRMARRYISDEGHRCLNSCCKAGRQSDASVLRSC